MCRNSFTIENVTIRKIEAYIGALPHLQSLQFGGVEIKGKITVDGESVRQMVLDMVTTGANVLQILGQTGERENPEQEQPPANPTGARRYQRRPAASDGLKEHLRHVDPTYKVARAARDDES